MSKSTINNLLFMFIGSVVTIIGLFPLFLSQRNIYWEYGKEVGMINGSYIVINSIKDRIKPINRKDIPDNDIIDFVKAGSLAFIKKDDMTIVVPVK